MLNKALKVVLNAVSLSVSLFYPQLWFRSSVFCIFLESNNLYIKLQMLRHLDNRIQVHKDAINFCQEVLQRKSIDCETLFHNELSRPIRNVDLVVTVGGDGTLLQASHFMDDSIPVVGVNSDPTQVEEVLAFFNFAHTLHPSLFSSQLLLAISPKSPFSK